MVLPVLPPGAPHQGTDHEILSDTTDTFDGESYVDIPRDMNSPSEHLRAPSLHDGAHPPAPVMQREGGHIPGSFEPSRHNFAPGSSTGDTSSDVSDSPRPHRARGIEDPRYGHRGGDRHHDMRNYRGGRGHPRDFGSPMSSHSSDSNGMVIPPQMDSPHSSSSRSREFDSPRPQRRPMERDIESPRYPGGYAGRDMAHGPVHMSTPSPESNGMVIPPHMDSPHSSSSRSHGFDSPRSSPGRPRERGRTNVIFQDEDGNEIHRVGDFSGKPKKKYREQPIVVQDEFGPRLGTVNQKIASLTWTITETLRISYFLIERGARSQCE
ncbi:hypothetical protein HWV62_18184 [Athelia sp. TMB]|nr:hypothetical protein HWV62_18184 [Athelia sp. TMB]